MTVPVVYGVVQTEARAYEAKTPGGRTVVALELVHRAGGTVTRYVFPLPTDLALELSSEIEESVW
ncbi:hypothetical protein [Kitasatospora sp. McL0602]|uniref:hypothetical protein n=1 Tax=Kitasatospora sp. McL0602 TaxID=3439530 RepID=UPI003F888CD1